MTTGFTVALITVVALEPVMTLVHRFLFHGPLWCWHKSHHEHPSAHHPVFNDLLWAPPLLVSTALVVSGAAFLPGLAGEVVAGIGIGTAAYVAAYVFAHDGVAHGRFRVPGWAKHSRVFRAIARSHNLHHRGGTEGVGAPPFGVYAAALEQRWGFSDGYSPPSKVCAPAHRARV